MTYIRVDERQEHCRVILSCQNNQLYVKHGLKDSPANNMHPLKSLEPHIVTGDFNPLELCYIGKTTSVSNAETRLYRSLENLHWAAMTDSRLYTHCGSVDSKYIFHCKNTCHLSEGFSESSQVQNLVETCRHFPLCPERFPVQRDLPVPPLARVPQWLLPSGDERALHGDAKRDLKEKLRIHSAKVAEPSKPMRPQASVSDLVSKEFTDSRSCQRYKNGCAVNYGAVFVQQAALSQSLAPLTRERSGFSHRLTNSGDIKQEALRRLQLRRQHSSPNLGLLHGEESKLIVASKTTEYIKELEQKGAPEVEPDRRRCWKGRMYIPTFEEFKRMRNSSTVSNKEKMQQPDTESSISQKFEADIGMNTCISRAEEVPKYSHSDEGCFTAKDATEVIYTPKDSADSSHLNTKVASSDSVHCKRTTFMVSHDVLKDNSCQTPPMDKSSPPICSGPAPRSPLQAVAIHGEQEEGALCELQRAGAARCKGTHAVAEHCLASDSPSSCCPSLLLEATDLSSYGAKLQKMKDEFIGSALDLIKKSCSAEAAAESPARMSCDRKMADDIPQEDSNPSSAISIATWSSKMEPNNEPARGSAKCTAGQLLITGPRLSRSDSVGRYFSSSCRRSSSDITHETADSAKAHRECRLRPHFSDPMPTDAVKRKQLEMKIAAAAAARLHAQRRRQEREAGPPLDKANAAHSCSFNKARNHMPSYLHRSEYRWSNVSSLSTDSGIVGLSDDKTEAETGFRRHGKSVEVERADSGIGQALAKKWKSRAAETLASLQAWGAHRPCTDCGERDFASETDSQGRRRENLCEKCAMRRTERKEAVLEFINTEASYGEDLRIIKEEFYLPMQSAGLLTQDQLLVVFSNLQELIDLNEKFLECLQEEIDRAFDQGDEDLITVCIGEIFLEFFNMLPAFQTYCLQQSASVTMLNTLEKEKELLRIFLNVSQNDNTVLRRMNLRSFLMAPLQRVTKYPLLLTRIVKGTIEYHPDHSSLWEAKSRIESHLEHINMKTKQEGNSWTLRSFRRESRKNREVINIEMREIAIKSVGWLREETRFVMEGSLQLAQPTDGQWLRKGSKALKFQNLQVLLMVNVKRLSESSLEGPSSDNAPHHGPVKDAVLVLIRDKNNGKFSLLREPLRLSNCIVSTDPDCDDTFEMLEIRREAFVFRDSDKARTHHWFRQIKRYSRELGSWKKRRNALPNIMISTTHNRS
ncbi:uncharacterized protein LOC115093516 [Rhinatrema bivittatum]|uniref:uncharacterized protein LOC115093516 n=1 Tax=Rhinatrema bivittatum TaxID=194408 RepID=UPI0011262FD8|nr:uncharacterized protein LOC115093516 [Rhinatrema bivittatum]